MRSRSTVFGFGVTRKPKEKRKYPRVLPLTSAPVEVQIMGTELLEVLQAEDISVGGIAIRVPQGFTSKEMSERVEVVVTLPGSKSFMATAAIRNISRDRGTGRFGLEFVKLSDVNREKVARYVEKMLKRGRKA